MIGGIKNIKAMPGKEKEFEKLFNELKSHVRNEEKGNIYYDLYHGLEPGIYIVMERYSDKEALEFHDKTKHAAIYFPKIRAILEKIHVEYFESVE